MVSQPFQLSRLHNLDPRGVLSACEVTKETGITFQRFFTISDVIGGSRGGHAHKFTHQVITCIYGSFTLSLKYKGVSFSYLLDKDSPPVFLPALTWVDMIDISSDCIILVLSSDEYDINNSLRSFEEYCTFLSSPNT